MLLFCLPRPMPHYSHSPSVPPATPPFRGLIYAGVIAPMKDIILLTSVFPVSCPDPLSFSVSSYPAIHYAPPLTPILAHRPQSTNFCRRHHSSKRISHLEAVLPSSSSSSLLLSLLPHASLPPAPPALLPTEKSFFQGTPL